MHRPATLPDPCCDAARIARRIRSPCAAAAPSSPSRASVTTGRSSPTAHGQADTTADVQAELARSGAGFVAVAPSLEGSGSVRRVCTRLHGCGPAAHFVAAAIASRPPTAALDLRQPRAQHRSAGWTGGGGGGDAARRRRGAAGAGAAQRGGAGGSKQARAGGGAAADGCVCVRARC